MDSDQGKIFVGGISWETTEEKLKDYFNGFGSVVESVIVKDRMTGRARGFGFVAFADPSVADAVLLEKHTIDGRTVEVKKAVPRDEQQNLPKSNNNGSVSGNVARTKKIFVGGLASSVTEEDFRNYFSQFGNITDVVVMYDPSTQRPRGFGFITFDTEDAVEKVIQQNTFHELHNKMVEVKKAVPRELSTGRGSGAGRGAPYNNVYSQGNNPSGPSFGGPRFVPPPASRGGYPSYGPSPYAAPGYGPTPGYGMPMNRAGYPSYGGGAGYPPAGAYGTAYGGAPSAGYAGAAGYGAPIPSSGAYVGAPPVGPRSPWGSSGTGFGTGGSPAAYGAGGASAMAGYGAPSGWNSGTTPQTNGSTGYNGAPYGYGATDNSAHNANSAAYPPRGMTTGPVTYNEHYAGPVQYGDSNWKSGENHSPAAASGYPPPGGMGASHTDGTGYNVTGRQTSGSDARFRPYPTSGERTA